ncbi:hypothetical protein LAZ67_8000791 [Cordylochernes scorpioides]|uniref:Endonuclease/exonuclease/phosphatase domain-containing protein n=1 Tax=Cordylochernes scorpioides TaxID=51811 RepID=A0ABY6KQ93_9ARAC|nr:hypothetical protein LAZ67_8000791 [Cordylochernes scorpioides]
MLNKAFPKNAPKRTTVFEWHSRFKAGRISIEDDPRQGRPTFQRTDENVQKITDLIKENPRTTLLELEQDTGISKTTIGRIVTEDLRLKKTPAKIIPRFLTNEQKLCRLATCVDMLEMTRTDPEWKDKIITGDETWVYGYDPETKRQSAEWRGQGEPRPKKSRILKSRNRVLLVAFLDNKGIVHHEYLPAGQTVIKEMYLSILRRLKEAIRKNRPEKWTNGDWILHHDNARPHTAHLVTSFLAKNGTEILPQPPYSPDIAINDFFLFPKLKAVLKGRHFDTREDIIEKSLLALKSIPKEAYKNCFDNWEKRWRCTANLFNFECQTFEAIIADTSLDSPEKIQMATKGLILTLVQEAELLLKDAFKGASLGRPNPTANVPIPSTSFASVVAEKDKPVKPAPPKPKAKFTFVNLAPSFESHVVVSVIKTRGGVHQHQRRGGFPPQNNPNGKVAGHWADLPANGPKLPRVPGYPTKILPLQSGRGDTAITSIAICLEQSIIVVHSAYWHGLRAADDFIPLLEDTIRRASLPVILGMDTNAHSPTWGIGARLDFRGANLEEFASFNDLHFLGPPVDSTWSNGPLSSSIDRLADRHGWFFEDQYKTVLGTVNGRSAEDALASIIQLIEEKQAHWRKTLVISSDIESITCLVKSFLEDRTVSYSAWTATECTSSQLGTPLGSALSPFLWNIVARTIFTLPSIIDSRLIAYADDFTLMTQLNLNSTTVFVQGGHTSLQEAFERFSYHCSDIYYDDQIGLINVSICNLIHGFTVHNGDDCQVLTFHDVQGHLVGHAISQEGHLLVIVNVSYSGR